MNRQSAFLWIQAVEDEYEAAKASLALAIRRTREVPARPDHELDNVEPSHLALCADHLEATYVVRLFAEFEAILRDYWATRRKTRPMMETLVASVATQSNMPDDWVTDVQAVREFRNDIVHHRVRAAIHTFQHCRSRLARFVSMLPQRW